MSVDGLNFDARPDPNNARFNSGVAREIYMEAITIDLKNVDFLLIQVMLRSRDGIPKFYGGNYDLTTHVPGAVNFYSNSNTYGGNNITPSALLDPQMQIQIDRVCFKVMTRLAITLPHLQALQV